MAVSKRLRYEVLARDNSTCQTCGEKAPEVQVTVDHVIPLALGGTDEPSNLVTKCRPCNFGKSSSHPDAPAVAAVAEDALRWSQAMQAAADAMLADRQARAAEHDQFREWWNNWGYGSGANRQAFPMDDAWRVSVDQIRAAGLPMAILGDCIDLAMSQRKVRDEDKFRYMCGVAWKKAAELRKRAMTMTSTGTGGESSDPDEYELRPLIKEGRAGIANEMLGELPAHDIERYMAEAREDWDAVTADEQSAAAVQIAFTSIRSDREWFFYSVGELLRALPEGLGEDAMRRTRVALYEEHGADFSASTFYNDAVSDLTQELQFRAARSYLADLPEAEQAEWFEYTRALFMPKRDRDSERSRYWTIQTAAVVQLIRSGGWHGVMCIGRGEFIRECPRLGTYSVWLEELGCCKEDGHAGHLVCERHMEQMLDGSYWPDPKLAFTVRDYSETDVTDKAPF